ncbi:pentatricopeptide repeat-containing protein At4g02750-like [Selaginella moellendorffii]|uniref:pentatricopeptide repeat-containing protein At4g02750-like n=1 Tax=Selaginella moellendorffii TaxID=88036 RepID=UPI000D1CDB86|nr:pentatricopeptide repeat-containing protein At4g02750-like [Selaginella moellendorffii]|eukprot:XP_024539668.1 pentatricopeptide repeat-containing protein At4g02750-like [Selaginella moellendorffii]
MVGDLEILRQSFDELHLQKDIAVWIALLSAYVRRGCLDEAKNTFTQMPERSSICWAMMITACAQNRHLEDAFSLFLEVPENILCVWNAMLVAYAQMSSIFRLEQFFQDMPERSVVSWGVMIAKFSLAGDILEAFQVFDHMKMVDLPDEACFVSLLIACSHEGEVYRGRSLFASMVEDYGITPTRQHYCCMVDLLARAKRLEHAKELLSTMPFEDKSFGWTSVISAPL